MNVKPVIRPEVNHCFFKGEIISWNFRKAITPVHGKYAFRFTLNFADGSSEGREKSGYITQIQCQKAKETAITQLNNHQYVAFHVSVKEFYDYWLYYHMADTVKITYNTFVSYRNIIYNYLVPFIGNKKLHIIKRNDLIDFFGKFKSPYLLRMGYSVIGSSFKFAAANNFISSNVAISAIKTKRGMEKKAARNNPENPIQKKRPVLNAQQMYDLIWTCEAEEHHLFLPLLITIATGCRVSELIALRFDSVNPRTGELHIKDQLGREIYSEAETGEILKQRIRTKSYAGDRKILLPEFIIDEIVLAKARYDIQKKKNPDFKDSNCIWHQANGQAHGKGDYRTPFNHLKKKLHLPDELHWHDLRHSYCTLMVANGANLKQLSVAMGHYSELFSLNVYTDMDFIISDGFPEFDSFINSVLPGQKKENLIVIDTMIDPCFIDAVLPA